MYRTLSAAAAVVITAMMFVPPALAQTVTVSAAAAAPSGTYLTKAAKVSVVGLDLNTAQGAAVALDRIEAASRVVCGEQAGYRMPPSRASLFQDCRARTVRFAVQALDRPVLTQLAAAR